MDKENIVKIYNTSGQPSFLMNNSKLLDKMNNYVKFEAADHKRRKEIIKVQIIKHLQEKMEEKYGVNMVKSTVQNYMQPRHLGMREAQ